MNCEDSSDQSPVICDRGRHHKVKWKKVPVGAWVLSYLGIFNLLPAKSYRLYILVLTFICYAAYHMSRKPFSVVANVLAPNCNTVLEEENKNRSSELFEHITDGECDFADGWPPFNGTYCKTIIGAIDYAWLFTYATFMIASGFIADRVNLRYFLTVGMMGSGIFVGLLGIAYFANIHNLAYYVIVQIFVGIFESTGWPATVAIMGNWFGKKNRGLLMGVWNSHASIGNILGTAVPSLWGRKCDPWGWAFLVPAFVMIGVALLIFFFLVLDPNDVGLPPPQHHDEPTEHHQLNGQVPPPYHDDKNDLTDERHSKMLTSPSIEEIGNEKTSLIGSASSKAVELKEKAVSLWTALAIPGVIEFSISLFFAKLVAYTFLFWLPFYVAFHPIGGRYIGEQKADLLATLYDVGGILGGITTGALSDVINARAISCVIMMYCAVPTLFAYRFFGDASVGASIVFIIFCGLFVNGPYALIITAVSSDLGTHESLRGNLKAKATVGAIIDGMGSLGAAFGPLVTGFVSDYFGWNSAFYVLMFSCFVSSLMLTRLVIHELRSFHRKFKAKRERRMFVKNDNESNYRTKPNM